MTQAAAFQARLTVAYAEDWAPDASGRPLAPAALPGATVPSAPGEVVASRGGTPGGACQPL